MSEKSTPAGKITAGMSWLESPFVLFCIYFVFFFCVSFVISDNVDDGYVFVLFAGPVTISGTTVAMIWLRARLAPNAKTMPRPLFYPLLFVFCLVLFFWYENDFLEDYWSRIIWDSFEVTCIVFLAGCIFRFSERRKKA